MEWAIFQSADPQQSQEPIFLGSGSTPGYFHPVAAVLRHQQDLSISKLVHLEAQPQGMFHKNWVFSPVKIHLHVDKLINFYNFFVSEPPKDEIIG